MHINQDEVNYSSDYVCRSCGTNQQPNTDSKGPDGNYYSCECLPGYVGSTNDCTGDSTATDCDSLVCTSCLASGNASYTDNSACVSCGNSTSGLGTSDCGCDSGALSERDAVGNKLEAKICTSCDTGRAVVTKDVIIAGVQYYKDLYSCQACPDLLMSMTVSGSTYSCTCGTGYTLVGVSTIGEQVWYPIIEYPIIEYPIS
ncbi:hypothetical protein B484DRAFT_157328 [Ochromonadaceae sp. CCMP2298]|nr:hypothetical protein B484DRAFT_157328 [Ochromonadaceae sp. CCMP2298]